MILTLTHVAAFFENVTQIVTHHETKTQLHSKGVDLPEDLSDCEKDSMSKVIKIN